MEKDGLEPAAASATPLDSHEQQIARQVQEEMARSISFCLLSPRLARYSQAEMIAAILKQNGFTLIGPPLQVHFSYEAAQAFCTRINKHREKWVKEAAEKNYAVNKPHLESPLMFEGTNVWIKFYRVDVMRECFDLFGASDDARSCRPGQLRYMYGIDNFDDGIYYPMSREEMEEMLPFVNWFYQAGVEATRALYQAQVAPEPEEESKE